MRRKIPCFCDNTFVADVPEEIDLDADPHYVEDILSGNFMNFTCASCGKRHKPEFPLSVKWPSKNILLEVLPELDRGEFYRRPDDKKETRPAASGETPPARETVISYPEMAERIALLRDGLVPDAVEAIKCYLFVKADEAYPEGDIGVWYQARSGESLEFHIHGIKSGEVAVTRIPLSLYEKTLEDFRANPRGDPFAGLRVKSYCSIQNTLRPDELK